VLQRAASLASQNEIGVVLGAITPPHLVTSLGLG
jgi:hypothetical protein